MKVDSKLLGMPFVGSDHAVKTIRKQKSEGDPRCWWEMLPAIPPQRTSPAYERLKRVWFDHTWREHPFMRPSHENHLTATLFENFVLFEPSEWLRRLAVGAGITADPNLCAECAWGYEVLTHGGKLADVAIHTRGQSGDSVIVIESKARGGTLKPTDSDPGSYLDLDEFCWAEKRWLIYLVDAADEEAVRAKVVDPKGRSGFLTWQALGGLQIELARALPVAPELSAFVAGAIQYQYLQHEIVPTVQAADYLNLEPAATDIGKHAANKMTDWATPWRIPI